MYVGHTADVPGDRMNVTEQLAEVPSSLLNRSLDTASAARSAGRRTRSAAAAARRAARLRPAASTSSVPAPDTTTAAAEDQTTAVRDADHDAAAAGETTGSTGRRPRRRRRTENETEKENRASSVPPEPAQLMHADDTQPVNGSFAASTDSGVLASPKTTEAVKKKKRIRKKSRGSTEALSGDRHDVSTADQDFEPDLSISKDFSQSFEMRTSSPVEKMFKPPPVSSTTECKVSETDVDSNLWMICDTPLNELCKRLLADQNFGKLPAVSSSYQEETGAGPDSTKRVPFTDDAPERKTMEVDVEHRAQPTANVSKPETTTNLPPNVKSQENQVDIVVLPMMPSVTTLPTKERPRPPSHRRPRKHKKELEDVQAEQQAATRENETGIGENTSQFPPPEDTVSNRNVPNILSLRKSETENAQLTEHKNQQELDEDSRPAEENLSLFSAERDVALNKNVPNVLTLKETGTYHSKLPKVKKQVEDVPAQQIEPDTILNRNVPNVASSQDKSRLSEEPSLSQFSIDQKITLNKNVPNVLTLKEAKTYDFTPSENRQQIEGLPAEQLEPDTTQNRNVPNVSSSLESKLVETMQPGEPGGKGIPDIISEPAIVAPDEKIQAADGEADDVTAAEELERLEREQRQLMEEEELQQEQEDRERQKREERARREQLERDQEEAERRERKRQEKEDKERRRRERKERKELEKRQRETLADETPAGHIREPQHVLADGRPSEQVSSPAVSTPDSRYVKETADTKIEEPKHQVVSTSREVPDDPYADIPMVDDFDEEGSVPPVREQTPVVEKSAKKKPPSGRKMPPSSPLFPAPVPPPKPQDGDGGDTPAQKDTLTYFRVTSPRTTLKEAKARDRASSSVRQRSRSADRSMPPDRGQTRRTGSYFTLVDIDIESAPSDSGPPSLSASFDGGRPISASSPIPPDFAPRRTLRPARSEEVLFVKKLSSRSPTPSLDGSSFGFGDGGGQWMRTAKSIDVLNRSAGGSEFGEGLGRRSLSREWQFVTTTTKEEIVFVKRPEEDTEERKRIRAEYEKNKQAREMKEQSLMKEREKIERERLERLLAELRRRRQKERQQILDKKLAEKRAKEENDRFIRQAIEQQRQMRLEEDKARREEEQRKRDELNERWQREKEDREKRAKENRDRLEQEREEKLERELQLRQEREKQERDEQARREKELREKREKEEKERRERELKQKLEQERQRKEKLVREEKLRVERMEREEKLWREQKEKEQIEKAEAKKREEEEKEKESELMEKLAEEHRLKLEKLEEEIRLQQKQLERERLKKEKEVMEKLAQEHKLKLDILEREKRLEQNRLEREQLEKEKTQRILHEKMEKEKAKREEMERHEIEENKRREEEQRKAKERIAQLEREQLEREETERQEKEEMKRLELERLEREALDKIIQEQKERLEKLEREEQTAKMTDEHKIKPEKSEEQSRFEREQLQLEREQMEKQKLRLEKLEHEQQRVIQEQKDRLEKFEREEKQRALEKAEKERLEREERRLKRSSGDSKEGRRRSESAAEQEVDSVFDGQPSTSLLSPGSPERQRLPSHDMATQTEESSPEAAAEAEAAGAATVVGQVRDYPADVVTERLVSDSESLTSSPVPNTDHRATSPAAAPGPAQRASARSRTAKSDPADSPFRKRSKSAGASLEVSAVIVHEYGELLSFWRGDPTDGRLTQARANSRRAAAAAADDDDDNARATVREFDSQAERWSTRRLRSVDDDRARSAAQQRPQRHQDDGRPASAAENRDAGEKSSVHSTLGWIG